MRPASAPTLARLHRAVAATATRSVTTRATPPPPLTVYYADWARVILPDGHRFPMDKYAETRRALREDASLRGKIDLKPSPKATLEEIHTTHCPEYVRRVLTNTLSSDEIRKIGFPMGEQHSERSLASTGGTLACARDVLNMPRGRPRAVCQIAGACDDASETYLERTTDGALFRRNAPRLSRPRRRVLRLQRHRGRDQCRARGISDRKVHRHHRRRRAPR